MKTTLKKNSFKLLVFMFVIALLTAACSSSNTPSNQGGSTGGSSSPNDATTGDVDREATVLFWHAFGEGEEEVLLDQVLPKFNEQYPNITIDAVRMPTENLEQQVITAVSGNVAPDLMRMDNTWTTKFAKEGALQTIDHMPGFDEIVANSFEGPMSTSYYDGHHYGVPLDTNTKIAIYNKELLAEAGATSPPETMDELVALARVMKENGKYGITIGGVDAWNMPPWFWTLGGRITDEEYTVASGYLNSEASIQALETMIGWHEEGLLAPPILAGQPGTWEGLRGEEGMPASYLMINEGPWFFGILGDAVVDTMIPAKMPNGPSGKSHSVIGGQDLVFFKGAKELDAAWIFAQFLLSEEIQVLMAVETGAIPTNIHAANSAELDEVYYLKYYVEELETALARTPSAEWDRISMVFQEAFESAFRNMATPAEALNKAAKEIDELLAR